MMLQFLLFLGGVAHTLAEGQNQCSAAVAGVGGVGPTLKILALKSIGVDEMDAECCAACASFTGCEFWLRQELTASCWLRKSFEGSIDSPVYRTGFINQSPLPCKVMKFIWGVQAAVFRRVKVNAGKVITNLRIELPNTIECPVITKGSFPGRPHTSINVLDGVTSITDMGYDLRSVGKSIHGSVQTFIQLNPEFNLDFDKCEAVVSNLNLMDLGVGINNEGGRLPLPVSPQKLSGPYHARVLGNGHDPARGSKCTLAVPARPGQEVVAAVIPGGIIHVSGDTQEDKDRMCCEACAKNTVCEAFTVQAIPGASAVCWLKRQSVPTAAWHANFRGNTSAMAATMYGLDVGTYYVTGDTQEKIDANCAKLCDEIGNCESWIALVSKGPKVPCYLKGGEAPMGLINEGILGINGKTIGNSIGKRVLKKILDFVMKHLLCKKPHAHVAKLLGLENTEVTGEGVVSLDMPASFSADDFMNPSGWNVSDLRVSAARYDIVASDPRVQPLVDDVVHLINETLPFVIPEMGSLVGSIVSESIKECTNHPLLCRMLGGEHEVMV